MLTGRTRSVRFLLILADAAATVAAFVPAYFLVGLALQRLYPEVKVILPLADYWWAPVASIPMWWILIASAGGYSIERIPPTWSSARMLIKPMAIGAMMLGFGIFALQEKDFARRVIGSFLIFNFLFIVGERKLIAAWLHRTGPALNLLVAGSVERASELIKSLSFSSWDTRLIGAIDGSQHNDSKGIRLFGGVDVLPQVLADQAVDGVIVSGLEGGLEELRRIVARCEDFGIPALIDPALLGSNISLPRIRGLQNSSLIELSTGPRDPVMLGIKRVLDIFLAGALILFFLPLLILLAIVIKISSRGGVFFVQERIGLNGRRFRLFKFRSMYEGSDKRLSEVAGLNISDGPAFKAARDPRITPIGRVMRKFCIDELPQLFNVLKGDMSLVGPRPLQVFEVAGIVPRYRRRLSMRPGITGLWQVSGGHSLPFDEWMKLDLDYIDGWSLRRDISIMIRTIPVVLGGKNL